MKKIIALAIVAGMLLLPAAALAQTGPSYKSYADQAVINTVDSLKMMGNGVKAIFGGANGTSNAQFLGEWQANATVAANASTVGYLNYLSTMATDAQSQADINIGFQAMGMNASQIQCGTGSGPSQFAGTASITGNCKTNAGTKGLSNVSRLKAADISAGTVNTYDVKTGGAQAIAALIRGGLVAWVQVQVGTVGGIDPFSN